jgi:Mn-dependent DtxR family transcriptional regulator
MSGGREVTVDDVDILRLFDESGDPFLFTGEVAAALDFTSSGALKRLKQLESKGFITSKRSGKVPGWWLTDTGRDVLSGDLDVDDLEER